MDRIRLDFVAIAKGVEHNMENICRADNITHITPCGGIRTTNILGLKVAIHDHDTRISSTRLPAKSSFAAHADPCIIHP